MGKFLDIIGLSFSFWRSISLAVGLFISEKRAIELGVSRWSVNSNEENIGLPAVQDRLKQRKYAIIGASLLFAGFILQFLSQIL